MDKSKNAALLIDTTVIDRLAQFFPADVDGIKFSDTVHVLGTPSEGDIRELLNGCKVAAYYDPDADSTTFASLHDDSLQLLTAKHVQDGTGGDGISRFSTITFAGSDDLAEFVETHGVVKAFDSVKLFLALLGDSREAMTYLDSLHVVGLDTSNMDYIGMVLPAGTTPPVIEELFGPAVDEIAANDSGVTPHGEETTAAAGEEGAAPSNETKVSNDEQPDDPAKATWYEIAIGIVTLVGVASVAGYAGRKAGTYIGEKLFGES